MRKMTMFLSSMLIVGACALQATAANITWGPATAVSTAAGNSSDVSTTGVLVEAYNAVNDTQTPLGNFDVTVNGVLFTATNDILIGDLAAPLGTDFSSGTNGGDATYDSLLSNQDFGGGGGLISLTVGDGDGDTSVNSAGLLGIGREYEIQVWFVEDRTAGTLNSRVMQFGDGNSNTVDLNDQFAIGSFTADATTQVLTFAAQGFGNAHIGAYQIRQVPEPSTIVLLIMGILGATFFRKKYQK